MRSRRQRLRRGLALVFLLALAIRLLFAAAVLEAHEVTELRRLNGDSREYLRLGAHLAATGRYTAEEDVELRVISLVRTPLYPAVVASVLKVESLLGLAEAPTIRDADPTPTAGTKWGFGGLFVLQAVGDALLCVLTGLVAWHLWRRVFVAWLGAAMMAVVPTGWGLSAVILTDGLFALLATLALWLTLQAARGGSYQQAVGAGLVWVLSALAKPTLLMWPILLPVVWWLVRSSGRRDGSRGSEDRQTGSATSVAASRTLLRFGLCWSILVAGLLGWCGYNYASKNVFTYSIVAERNVRFMYGPVVEMWHKYDERPPEGQVRERYSAMGHQEVRWYGEPGMTVAEYVRRQREYIGLMLPLRPDVLARLYGENLIANLEGSWDILVNQLPPRSGEPVEIGGMGTGGRATPVARTIFWPIFWLTAQPAVRWPLIGLALLAPLVVIRNCRRRGPVLAVWLFAMFILLTAATTSGQGSRILYPAYPSAMALLSGWLPRRRRRASLMASLKADAKMPAGNANNPMPSTAESPPSARPSGVTGAMSP